jgi:hypothetical protein
MVVIRGAVAYLIEFRLRACSLPLDHLADRLADLSNQKSSRGYSLANIDIVQLQAE